ncbi:MAG: hypothetical protein KIG60_01310 [Caryophanon sp.]|nr:hypothetical protein [Caryophanon sp.]
MAKTYEKVDGKVKMTKSYNQWFDMIQRATSSRVKASRPNYAETTIHDDWLDFNVWLAWAETQVGFNELDSKGKVFQIDKDLKGGSTNHYSPDTCVFLPAEINKALIISCKGFQKLPNGKYRSVGFCKGKQKSLGCFDTQDQAAMALAEYRKDILLELVETYKPLLDSNTYSLLIEYDFFTVIRGTY